MGNEFPHKFIMQKIEIIMNVKQLEEQLVILGVPDSFYSINCHLKSDAYILNQVYEKWQFFYFDEKGQQTELKNFNNEDEACRYFLQQLKKEVRYLNKQC